MHTPYGSCLASGTGPRSIEPFEFGWSGIIVLGAAGRCGRSLNAWRRAIQCSANALGWPSKMHGAS